jgi:hypothetical protein
MTKNNFFLAVTLFVAGISVVGKAQAVEDVLVSPFEVSWKYLDNGTDPGTGWRFPPSRIPPFDDSSWATGLAPLGYGYGEVVTVTGTGAPTGNAITSYYRTTFNINQVNFYDYLDLNVVGDDGMVVYINGQEVLRHNLPAGKITSQTAANSELEVGSIYDAVVTASVSPTGVLRRGVNTVAVELHQASTSSPDAVFALGLSGHYAPIKSGFFDRGPYLQMITPTSAVVRWGTTIKNNSVVRFGTNPAALDRTVNMARPTFYHEVKLKNLKPDTKYYYTIGTSTDVISGGLDHFFQTQPLVGTAKPTRIWVIGDSGRNNQNQRDTYQAYLNYTGSTYTDLWLLLGDNAYYNGTDQEYQNGFFNIYNTMLHQTVVWPSLGNHDGYSVDTPAQNGPYYNMFTLPTKAEAGGIASGTEAYYSYNYGNIHFVVLDAFDVDRSPGGAMAQWLEADLAANQADWLIAYWHHPPYSKGSHNSDTEIELIEMRENIVPILEAHGVDLVLSGHSHNYERSKFVQGHYGYSNTYSDGLFALDVGSGNPLFGAPAYTKAHPAVPHGGTVYAVVGTAAEAGGGTINHPVMYQSFNRLGTMVLDVDHLTLSAKFIDELGVVQDAFTLQKVPSP